MSLSQFLQSQQLQGKSAPGALRETETQTRSLPYSMTMALGLLKYAKENEVFAAELKQMIDLLPLMGEEKFDLDIDAEVASLNLMAPGDRDTALRRAQWLVYRIMENESFTGAAEASAVLNEGILLHAKIEPKPVIIGVVGVAIPGITLGLIKKRQTMAIIASPGFKNTSSYSQSRAVGRASLGVIQQALTMVKSDAHKLEPDVADWFFGERTMRFFETNQSSFNRIAKEMNQLNIPHTIVEESNFTVMAMSPSVNITGANWGLKAVE